MKRLLACLAAAALLLSLVACTKTEQNPEQDATNLEEDGQIENEQNPGQEEEQSQENLDDPQDENEEQDTQTPDTPPVTQQIYVGDDQAEALEQETVELADDAPETLVQALVDRGVLAADVALQTCTFGEQDGKQTIYLDFNEAFSTQIHQLGTSGEWILLGSVVNTFLTAYPENEQVVLTVAGETLETGHNVYEEPLTWYEQTAAEAEQLLVSYTDGEETVPAQTVTSSLGVQIQVAEDTFSWEDEPYGLQIYANENLPEAGAVAYLAVSELDYSVDAAVNGLLLQADDPYATCTDAYLGAQIPAKHITTQDEIYNMEYFVFDADGRVLLVEMAYANSAVETYLPILIAMLNTFQLTE